mmetsp:Transcript_21259/g.39392  ORF Transcript_21259/g.39392 Transcript_21259/m.39392 type:complete len:1049 (-) Transcript_21259:20-3166(-)
MGTATEVGSAASSGGSGSRAGTEVVLFAVPESLGRSLAELPAPEAFRPAVTIVSVACGGGLAAFITAERRLYLMDLREPPAQCGSPRIVEALRGERVQCMACGTSHVIIITTTGAAYTLASPSSGDIAARAAEVGKQSLSRGTVLATMGRLNPLQLRIRTTSYAVSAVSCGNGHVLLVGDGGTLFSFGEGRYGQLGLGDDVERTLVPTNVQGLKHLRVVDVAAGDAHSCAITSFGNLFVWGDNQQGQLGDGSVMLKTTPLLLSSLESVRAVAASQATAALCASGSSFVWGFDNHRVPSQAFDQPLGRIALSRQVLCGVSLNGDLLMRAIGSSGGDGRLQGTGKNTALAEQGISSVAAAAGHIVALKGQRPSLPAAPSPAGLPAMAPPHLRPPSALPPTQLADALVQKGTADDPMRREAMELEAANARLAMALDEVKAEHFFATAQIRSTVEAADTRAAQAGAALARQHAQAAQLADVARVLGLQEELATLRTELRQADEEREAVKAGLSPGEFLESEGTNAAVTRDLRDKHQQLALEHSRLCEEREALQARILSMRTELGESGQRLRRVEDACVRTRVMVERQRLQVASMQQQTSRLEEEALRTEELLPTAISERTRLDEAAMRFALEREGLETQNAQLELEQQRLAARLLELRRNADTQSRDHQDLLSEVRCLTLEHTSSEQLLAQKQAVCARLEGEIYGLRSENAEVKHESIELKRFSVDAERSAHILADEALRQCNSLRAQLGSGSEVESQILLREQSIAELRSRLAASEAEEKMIGEEITQRATQFAEEVSEQKEMVWKLHALLSDMRTAGIRPAASPGFAAADAPESPTALARSESTNSGSHEHRSDTFGAGSIRKVIEQPVAIPPLHVAALSGRAPSEPRHAWAQSTQPAPQPGALPAPVPVPLHRTPDPMNPPTPPTPTRTSTVRRASAAERLEALRQRVREKQTAARPTEGAEGDASWLPKEEQQDTAEHREEAADDEALNSLTPMGGPPGGRRLSAGSADGIAKAAATGLVDSEAQHVSDILRQAAQRREELLARMARA